MTHHRASVGQAGCRAETKHGCTCRGVVPAGRQYCLAHDPELVEQVRLARARGGTAAAKVRALQGKRLRLDSAASLLKFNANLCQDTLSGAVEPGVSKAVSYAIANQLRLLEASDLARQVAELRERIDAHGRPRAVG